LFLATNESGKKVMKKPATKRTSRLRSQPHGPSPQAEGLKPAAFVRLASPNRGTPASAGKASATPEVPPSSHSVAFQLVVTNARDVFLAGSFNQWNPSATVMTRLGEGKWVKELLLPPGRYEYLFVVDGHWIADPKAPDYVPNPFGGCNSVLRVT
jgi:hypothetical protein